MSDNTWETLKDTLNIIGTFLFPVIAWMFYTIFNHSRKIVMLEQKMNESIDRRLDNLEGKFDSLDQKFDHLQTSIHENRLHIQESMEEKFGMVLTEIRKNSNDD